MENINPINLTNGIKLSVHIFWYLPGMNKPGLVQLSILGFYAQNAGFDQLSHHLIIYRSRYYMWARTDPCSSCTLLTAHGGSHLIELLPVVIFEFLSLMSFGQKQTHDSRPGY